MRSAVGIFGFVCGLIVIGLVGRYGFKSTDIETDAWIMAFLFAAIAAGGLFGHAVSVRLWQHSKPAAIAMGLVSIVALLLNLSNSLGAIAGRADTVTTARIDTNRKVRAADTELKRLSDLRDAMPAFVATDAAAIQAAQRAANAAMASREAECAKRGNNCRAREDDERAANDRLAKASTNKAATDRANKLEADAQVQREKLATLGPVVTVNVQGAAITKLFRLPDSETEFAATAQQFGIAVVVELIILMALIAWEVLGHERRLLAGTDRPEPQFVEPISRLIEHKPAVEEEVERVRAARIPAAPAIEHVASAPQVHSERIAAPVAALPVTRDSTVDHRPAIARKLPPPARPKLAIANKRPVGAVLDFLHDGVEITAGPRTEITDAFIGYSAWCKAIDHRAMSVAEFVDAMEKACKQVGIRINAEGDLLYLQNVQLSRQAEEAAQS